VSSDEFQFNTPEKLLLTMGEVMRKLEDPTLEQMIDLAGTLISLPFDDERAIAESLLSGLELIDMATYGHPEIRETATTAMRIIFLGLLEAGYGALEPQVRKRIVKSKRMKPLIDQAARSASVAEDARTEATNLWQADTAQEFRIEEMAEIVEEILKRKGVEGLPKRNRIKEWIKQVAPSYASKPGRPSKST